MEFEKGRDTRDVADLSGPNKIAPAPSISFSLDLSHNLPVPTPHGKPHALIPHLPE